MASRLFPLLHELNLLCRLLGIRDGLSAASLNGLQWWIATVREALAATGSRYPFLAYGTDWLAFGHLMIALFFFGPLIDPVRNQFVLRAGIITCILVIPTAMICGQVRQIPLGWRLIDCCFGLFGVVPLIYALRLVRSLERAPQNSSLPLVFFCLPLRSRPDQASSMTGEVFPHSSP